MDKVKAIIFDLDGTLLDTLDDITNSVNYTLEQLKLPHVDKLSVRQYLGHGAKRLWQSVLKDQQSYLNQALDIYIPYLEKNSKVQTKPYEGIMDLLHQLKGTYQLGVVSNKHQKAVEEIISHYFNGIFDLTIGERPHIAKKPDPAPLLYALDTLKLNKDEVIFIGDSEVDIQTGKNAQVQVIGVTWGFRDIEQLIGENPDYLVDKVEKILKIIGE